jgi:hypothetical protein
MSVLCDCLHHESYIEYNDDSVTFFFILNLVLNKAMCLIWSTTDSLWNNKLRFSNCFFSSPSESTNKTKLNKQKNMTGASSEA